MENECQSPSPNQRDTCATDTADVRDEMRYVNVYTFNLPMEYTHVRSRGNSAPNMADRWQWRTAAGAECEGSRSVRAVLFTPLKGLARANATFTHVYSVMGPQLNTHKELCGGSGSACVNTAAPHATFLCNSQFLGALSASGLPAPLGIASLMNANGKGLIQLKSMNNGGAWCCSAASGFNHRLSGGFTKHEKVRDGLEIPTACFRDAPSRGSWLGEGFPPSAPWFSHWSPCRTARWGFLSGWEINMEENDGWSC